MSVPVDQQGQAIAAAATKYQVPLQTLIGIYGLETSYGTGINTSTAGAIGAFQFIPSTAASYGYPLTNDPTPQQFAQQADAAAHYLHDLYNQEGHDWTKAAAAYNAGPANIGAGMGYANGVAGSFSRAPKALVQAALSAVGKNALSSTTPTFGVLGFGPQAPAGSTPPGTSVSGPLSKPDIGGVIAAIWEWVTTPSKWLIILKFGAGVTAIYLAIKGLAGIDSSPIVSTAATAAEAVK